MAAAAVELPFLASHYGIAESTLHTLTQEPTAELVNQLLTSITAKAREFEDVKSEKLRVEVELENAVRTGESKVKVLKESVDKGLTEIANLRKSLQESENKRAALESEIATLKSSLTSDNSELSTLKSRISSLEASNRDTLALLESKTAAYDKLAEELSAQHKKTIELRREVSTIEQSLQTANSASSSARFREQNLQQELELVKKNNDWFETELKTKSAEYMKFRKEKSARIAELQRTNEEANSNVEGLQRNENALKSRLSEIEHKYDESLTTIQQMKEEAIQVSESFRLELESASRLAELQKNSAETAKQRVQECQLSLEKLRDEAGEEIARLRTQYNTEHVERESAEKRVAELEVNVEQLESEIASLRNQSMSPGRGLNGGSMSGVTTPIRPSTPLGGATFSPRTSRTKGGLTLTQMYSEYDKMRTLLSKEQKSNQELRATLDEMVQDIESSKPEIDDLRADHERLQAAVLDMSSLLDAAGKERDEASRESRKWRGQVEGLTREGDILRQQLRDLSSQVKVLVMEVNLLGTGQNEYDRTELEKVVRGEIEEFSADLNDTGRFISRNLTTFKSIDELQQQNVTLRRMLRELGDKMESAEAREREAAYQKDKEELLELRQHVQGYKDEIASLVARSNSYIKERDTFRSMLTRRQQIVGESPSIFSQSLPLGATPPTAVTGGENADYAELLRKVQSQFDTFRHESLTDQKSLKQQVNDLSRKNSDLQSEISRASSQVAAANQRAELLQSNFNLLKGENTELQKRYSSVMENANKQDLKTQQAAEDLVEARGLVESLQREAANLKAEKDLWKSIERRLIEDNESLRNERARLDTLNANLQTLLNEREHTDAESRRRLQGSVESLESELQTTKRKLNDETEEAKKAALRREYEHEQNQKRIDDLVTSLGSVREELASIKTSRDHLQSRVDELQVELRSAEEKLQVLQPKTGTSAPTSNGATEGAGASEDGSGLSREQELAVEVSELKRDLELTKAELEHSKEQVEDYKAIAQATEENLQSLSDTNEQYREDTDRLVEEKNQKIQELEKRIEEITSELVTTNNELSQLRDEQSESGRRLEDQKALFEAEIARLKDQEERSTATAQYHQQDIAAQAEIARNAQQNYENELLKHAEAAKTLQTVRAEAHEIKLEVLELRSQADSAKTSLAQKEESTKELTERYEREISELSKRREEVVNQNSILHEQLENITKQISSLQKDRAAVPEDDEETGSSGADLERLQEVIKFLRREKEIVDVQYHLSTQESKRLRQQLDYAQSQLDDTRLKLEQHRRVEADSEHNALNHKKLMDTLNELNLFRESSVTLRNQAKQAEAALADKSKHVDELVEEIEPLRNRIRELENLLETKDGEMKLLQEDRDRWQQRTQNILQKYDRVDPAEMEALKEQIAALEKERDEAVATRDTLQSQITSFPEQLKQAEDRIQDLRAKLTEQFKARSKELTGRINAKQQELNAVIQEKEVIQEELKVTKDELNEVKSKVSSQTPAPTAPTATVQNGTDAQVQVSPPAQDVPMLSTDEATMEKIRSLEEKIRRLEAALAEKDAEAEKKIKERTDKMKEILNNKLAEIKAQRQRDIDNLKAAHAQELETAKKAEGVPELETSKRAEGVPELTDAQARELCAKNETIRVIIRNNIRNALNKEKEAQKGAQTAAGEAANAPAADAEALKELEKKFNEEREALAKDREQRIASAVELAEKKLLAKVSMTEGRARNAQAKVEVVQKAATETPQKPVIEVWEIAKVTKAAPIQPVAKVAQAGTTQAASASPAPSPAVSAPMPAAASTPAPTPAQPSETEEKLASDEQTPGTPTPNQRKPSQPAQQAVTAQTQAPAQNNTAQAQQPGAGLPNKPPPGTSHHPAAGTGPAALRALHSGLPIARGGRGGGRSASGQQQNPFGPQGGEQQQGQQQATRGSGLPRGRGRGGRGGQQQHIQTGNVPQGQGQGSPGGGKGGALNASARQFIPQGNKRAREDGADGGDAGNNGKRIRGGGGGN